MTTFFVKTAYWISKLLNSATEYGKKFDARVTLGTCNMRYIIISVIIIVNLNVWLSKRTSSTLELLNLESFHSISLGESTTNEHLFKGGFIVNLNVRDQNVRPLLVIIRLHRKVTQSRKDQSHQTLDKPTSLQVSTYISFVIEDVSVCLVLCVPIL